MSRRLLQVVVSISALNAILGGGAYLVLGVKGLSLMGVNVSIDPGAPPWISVDYVFRALAGIWFSLGLMLAYLVPSIEKHTVWFRFACLAVFMMGVGRLLSVATLGAGSNALIAMALEFVLPPLLVVWQSRVARDARES
jgi:hypothetical protein